MHFFRDVSLPRFWAWWWPSITSCLPASWFERLNRTPDIRLFLWDGFQLADEHAAAPELDAVLLVPERLVLARHMQMPRMAMADVKRALSHEVERQTPFAREAVYFDAVESAVPAPKQGHMGVSLVVVPKGVLDAAVSAVADRTSRLVGVTIHALRGQSAAIAAIARRRVRSSRARSRPGS